MLPLPGASSTAPAQAPSLILLLPPFTGTYAHRDMMSTVPLCCANAHSESRWRVSPLVSASLQFAQISLLLLVHLLQLSQVDAVLHFHRIQHIQRHLAEELRGPEKSVTFCKQKDFYPRTIMACLRRTGSSFLCLQLYFLLGSSVLGKSMCDCLSMASSKICLLASRRQSRPFNAASGREAEEIKRWQEF